MRWQRRPHWHCSSPAPQIGFTVASRTRSGHAPCNCRGNANRLSAAHRAQHLAPQDPSPPAHSFLVVVTERRAQEVACKAKSQDLAPAAARKTLHQQCARLDDVDNVFVRIFCQNIATSQLFESAEAGDHLRGAVSESPSFTVRGRLCVIHLAEQATYSSLSSRKKWCN